MKVFIKKVEKHPLRRSQPAWECKSLGNLITTSIVSADECLKKHKEKLYNLLSISEDSLEIVENI